MDLLGLWCTKVPNITQSGSALPPKQETAEFQIFHGGFRGQFWTEKSDPKLTPNRPQIDPKSTPDRPQIDPESTPNRPPKTSTVLPRQVFPTVGRAGPDRAEGAGKGAGTKQQTASDPGKADSLYMIDWGARKCTEALGNCPVGLLLAAHMARSSKSGVQDCNHEIHGLVSGKPQLGF